MREIRPSGSEGGGTEFNRFSLPLSLWIPSGDRGWAMPTHFSAACYDSGAAVARLPFVLPSVPRDSAARFVAGTLPVPE